MIDLSIVIVNYKTLNYTTHCIDSILHDPPQASYEIVVVDNASNDDSAEWLETHYHEIRLIRSSENRGIAGGNNLGIRATNSHYVLLLNNDTVVFPDMINRMVSFLKEHPDASAVGGRLVNPDGSFQSSYNDFPSLVGEFVSATRLNLLLNPYHPSYPDEHKILQVDWISSACLMVRRCALEQVGLIDESFFIYGDEPDLQYRIRRQGGKIFFLPNVTTTHFGGRSLDRWKRRNLVYRGKLLFFRKHYGVLRTSALQFMLGSLSLFKAILWLLAVVFPLYRQRARLEINSNLQVLSLCASFRYFQIE